jgi:8-oxo-dGTP pyrophosphatase MutT (NUDIX family)
MQRTQYDGPVHAFAGRSYTVNMSATRTHLSAGVVVLRDTQDGCRFLLLRAYSYWDFPKGAVEPGETPLQAAIREVQEETGLHDLEFKWGEAFRETEPYNRGKIARYYLASSQQEKITLAANPETGIHEHIEYRWVSYAQALKLVTPRVKLILDWADAITQGVQSQTISDARE